MNRKVNVFFLVFSVYFIGGCATTYKDFKLSNVKPSEGVAIGKVNIKYNGRVLNKECAVCLGSTAGGGNCQNLTDEGIVFISLPTGEANIRRIACKDTSIQHFNLSGAKFQVGNGLTYFGQVDFEWANKGGFKVSDLFGAIGAAISESNNDGIVKMSVKDSGLPEVLRLYEQQTQQEKVKAVKSLPTVNL